MDKYWLPPNISAHGADIDFLINIFHYMMVALFVGWGLLHDVLPGEFVDLVWIFLFPVIYLL